MRLNEILSVVWKRKLVVVLVLACCVVGAGLYAFSQPKKDYASGATIAFLPDPETKTVTSPESLSSLLSTYAVVAQSEQTPTRVRLAVSKVDGQWRAGGMLIQSVAEADARGSTAEAWTRTQAFFEPGKYLVEGPAQRAIHMNRPIGNAVDEIDLGTPIVPAQQRYAAGVADNLAVSQAQASMAQADDQLVSSLYQHNVAKLSLARALGIAQTNYKDYVGGK